MTTATVAARPPARERTAFSDVLRMEWTKLRSVRSTYWTVLVGAALAVGISILFSVHARSDLLSGRETVDGFDATLTSLNGLYLVQVAIGALGVLVISSEYSTGMIRATMTAVPHRRTVLAAKATVFAVFTFIVGEIISFAGFFLGQAIMSDTHASATLATPHALRAVLGGGLYLTAVGLLGFGLGAAIRHTAGGLSAFFGVMFASTVVVDLLPTTWRNRVIDYMPANAGSQVLTTVKTGSALGAWQGLGVLCLYSVAAIAVAAVLIGRRDV